MKYTFLIFFAFVALVSCEKDTLTEVVDIRIDKELILELNNRAADTVKIGLQKFVLSAYLYRDFMPIGPNDGKPLISANTIITIDSTFIPDNINLVCQYVINKDSIWIANYEDELICFRSYYKQKVSINGPKWGPNIYVDVIVKILDANKNKEYYLKAENILIERTD